MAHTVSVGDHGTTFGGGPLACAAGLAVLEVIDRENLVDVVREEAPGGLDRIFITSPPSTIPEAFPLAHFGAVIVFNGISFVEPMITFDANEFHFKRLQLRATHSIPNLRFPIAIDLLKRRIIDPSPFITHSYSFDQVADALTVAERDKAEVVKVVISII